MKKIICLVLCIALLWAGIPRIYTEARTMTHLNGYFSYCAMHSGTIGSCTYICLAAVFDSESKKCTDAYWYSKKYHFPNIYSFETPGYNDVYAHALFSRSDGLLSALMKKLIDFDFGMKTWLLITSFDSAEIN